MKKIMVFLLVLGLLVGGTIPLILDTLEIATEETSNFSGGDPFGGGATPQGGGGAGSGGGGVPG
jgi:hypothetical protein